MGDHLFLMTIPTYQQPIKEQARRFLLERAVTALTTDRNRSAIVTTDEFGEVLEYAVHFLENCGLVSLFFRPEVLAHAADWYAFYDSVIGTKQASELRVLYLCGPEPQNDLRMLFKLGVIPQNVWAIESSNSLYGIAVEQLKRDDLYIRIHHGSLETFFDTTNEQFDIVYIDACGAMPGGHPNTLRSPLLMFHRERLRSTSVLITNFSQPATEKQSEYERLFCYYFASRYNDVPAAVTQAGADPAEAHADPSYLLPYVHDCFDDVYSDFVTRLLVDLGREIVPYARIYDNKDLRNKYFSSGKNLRNGLRRATSAPPTIGPDDTPENYLARFYSQTGDVFLNSSSYPVLRFFQNASKDKGLENLIQPLISYKLRSETIGKSFSNTTILAQIIEGHWDVASREMKLALAQSWIDSKGGLFCDVPLPNLLINSLFGIYGHPYLPNPRQSARFSYIAKATKMYTDLLVLDQCRYYFDYLPTIDLIPSRFQSHAYQLILRACLDRIGRHDFCSSAHPFRGAALGSFDEFAGAIAYDFLPRTNAPPSGSTGSKNE